MFVCSSDSLRRPVLPCSTWLRHPLGNNNTSPTPLYLVGNAALDADKLGSESIEYTPRLVLRAVYVPRDANTRPALRVRLRAYHSLGVYETIGKHWSQRYGQVTVYTGKAESALRTNCSPSRTCTSYANAVHQPPVANVPLRTDAADAGLPAAAPHRAPRPALRQLAAQQLRHTEAQNKRAAWSRPSTPWFRLKWCMRTGCNGSGRKARRKWWIRLHHPVPRQCGQRIEQQEPQHRVHAVLGRSCRLVPYRPKTTPVLSLNLGAPQEGMLHSAFLPQKKPQAGKPHVDMESGARIGVDAFAARGGDAQPRFSFLSAIPTRSKGGATRCR
ncbi:hypothetical protein C8R44DRAFT_732679 [Mycena epipterygia]|nr:hypothetical protein C8R44DRAFT_732679 [Mycena epipterygia]